VAAHIQVLAEPVMRASAMAEMLAAGPAEVVVQLVKDLIGQAIDTASAPRLALDALVLVLSDGSRLGYDRRAELYAAAVEAGLPEVALLLLDAAPPLPGAEKLKRELGQERAVTPGGRPLALGERKALARAHRRDVLLHLMRDPHPDVIAVLIDNPHLTESDVLRLASRRPMLPAALAAIAASDRWRARLRVRCALVLNPFTPLPLAARLAITLGEGDLRRVAMDPALDERLRRHASRVLELRRAAASRDAHEGS
jgi:hypothetical protein